MKRSPISVLVGALCVCVLLAAAPASSPVADVARRGDADSVRTLLQGGADVNAAHGDGMTALHWAAERGDAEMASMLIHAGANLAAVTRIGQYTPLHVASRNANADVVSVLLEAGADVHAVASPSGSTALHLAAGAGNADAVRALLDKGAEVNALEAEWGQTPLIFAAAQNRVAAIKVLLEHGADPNITSSVVDLKRDGKLEEASARRRGKVLEEFQDEAALEGKEAPPPTANQLKAAVLEERKILLTGEIPPDDKLAKPGRRFRSRVALEKKGGLTALLHAARQGHVESVAALLDGDADVNLVSAGDGTSPLLMATINAQYDLAIELIERGADPNIAAGVNGVSPLWAAVNAQWQPRTRFPQPQEHGLQKETYLDLMEALLEAGANADHRIEKHPWYMVYTGCGNRNCGLEDTWGSTAFWRASYATDVDAMRLLVKYGADPNVPSKTPPPQRPRSGTVFELEAKERQPIQPLGPSLWPATQYETVKPDPSGLPKSKEGDPGVFPLHAAAGVGYGEGFAGNAHRHAPDAWLSAVKYLVEELGADVNARDFNGYNALHHAAARGDNDMILYLVSKGCDVTAVSRSGQTTADMANGPVQRVSPFPETVALLESLGSKNNHNCVTC